jgi:hypothetical protein
MLQSIRCPQCGWQNEPTAIMCGGCGQPLRTTAAMGVAGSDPLPSAEPTTASDLPTLYDVPPPVAASTRHTGAPWPGTQAAPQPRARGRGFRRGLLALAITLAVLAVIAGGLWSLLVRPALHSQVDGLIGQSLDQAVARVPQISADDLPALGSIPVTAGDINAELQQALPSGSRLNSVTVLFRSGMVVGTYSAYGTTGTVQTTLQVQGGQLQVAGTQVSGPLGWVETGDELQATLNQGLAQLSSKTPHGFDSVSVGENSITLVLNTTG